MKECTAEATKSCLPCGSLRKIYRVYPGPLNFTALSAVVGMVCATMSACINELANTECVLLNCECSSGFTGGYVYI